MTMPVTKSQFSPSALRTPFIACVIGLLMAGCAGLSSQEQARQAEQARLEAEQKRLAEESWKRKQRDEEARRIAEERARPRVAAGLRDSLKVGRYRCELKRNVTVVSKLPNDRGVVLSWKKKNYEMVAVQSNTGALRLENERSGLVWITIVGKSMLFDSKSGRQLANECKL